MSYSLITVQELSALLSQRVGAADLPVQLVDVREPQELELAALPGFQRFSLSEFGEWGPRLNQLLDSEKETLVLCHHGMRSAQMCAYLVGQGFTTVKNIQGGIAAYSQIDPTIPSY